MWAIRRASIPLRNRAFSTRISIAFSSSSDLPSSCFSEGNDGTCESAGANHATRSLFSDKLHFRRRCFSSEASGAKISGVNDDDEDIVDQNSDEDANDNDGLHSDLDAVSSEKDLTTDRASSGLSMAIMAAPGLSSVHGAIDEWIKEGNALGRQEYVMALRHLKKLRLFRKALQLSEWWEKHMKSDLSERDYASRVDLIAKVYGLYKAELYIEKIPESLRGEVVYRTLLACAVASNMRSKPEEIFNKMKGFDFPLTIFVCNQLLLHYSKLDKKKIADVQALMEKENVKPNLFTYKLLINARVWLYDITRMEQIVDTMKEQGIEPDATLQASLAKHYINAGQKEKAAALLEKIESDPSNNPKQKRWSTRLLLPLYAALGKTDDVQRLGKLYESSPGLDVSIAAIEAWGKLNKVEEAEAEFDKLVKARKKVSPKLYLALLKIYADHKMLTKGKELAKLMSDSGCPIDQYILDALVKLYADAGEIEKAESILQKAEKNRMRPRFSTYQMIMDQYAKRGDIHNSERVFYRMRQQDPYIAHPRQFQALMNAYINAKAPLYGIRERMKADNIFPDRGLVVRLAQVDAVKKASMELLD